MWFLVILLVAIDRDYAASGVDVSIGSVSNGPTPFIGHIQIRVAPPGSLQEIKFTIRPKPFSHTRPISGTYSANYLKSRGYLNPIGQIDVPVFGLYANYVNTVDVITSFTGGSLRTDTLTISTPAFDSPGAAPYLNPIVVMPRSSSLTLSYDYFMMKGWTGAFSPVIVDTDGEVRWIGTAGLMSVPAIFSDNSILVSNGIGITKMGLDGTVTNLADYSRLNVTSSGHHNYDKGKRGIQIEVNTIGSIESTIMEIDSAGKVFKTWSLADIISSTMIKGGDDPSVFVRPGADWFHNNATTYKADDDSVLVSSRENFVIALDYQHGDIKWILGDPSKAWYQYPSLRKYALTLQGATVPPIGQHAISITQDGDLLLFDNGTPSLYQTPKGDSRAYSAVRKYHVDAAKMTATETWNYTFSPMLSSKFCSSVYEDKSNNYLIDASLTGDLIGLNEQQTVFHYKYSTAFSCGVSWNAVPIHLENIVYDVPDRN